jgi:hypothetical protein
MLEIGSFRAKLCQGLSRRAFLKAGLLMPFALGMSGNATPQARCEGVTVLLELLMDQREIASNRLYTAIDS